jgi:hypothetical protein
MAISRKPDSGRVCGPSFKLSFEKEAKHRACFPQTIFKHFTLVFEKRPGLSRDRIKQHSELCGEILQTLLICGCVARLEIFYKGHSDRLVLRDLSAPALDDLDRYLLYNLSPQAICIAVLFISGVWHVPCRLPLSNLGG